MVLFDFFTLWYDKPAIIYNSKSGIIRKTYRELVEDVNNHKLSKYKVELIHSKSKYKNILSQLLCLKNNKVFCNILPNSTKEYIKNIRKELTNVPNKTTHIISSSGTTGIPKLIALDFNETLKTIYNQSPFLNINENSIVSSLLSFTFDASLADIYGALYNGACLYLTDTPLTKVKTLEQEIIDFKLTHLDLPPSLIKFFNFSKMKSVQCLVFGGEVACETEIKNITKLGIKCINSYGPTENSISSFMCIVDDNWSSNNIGKHICPEYYMEPYKIINNELYISTGLFLGYINNQELTGNRICVIDNRKYFKTGDLVYEKDNSLFYTGRIDRQFKRNGILICPEEVETIARKIGCEQALITNTSPYTLSYSGDIEIDYIINELKRYIPENRLPTKVIKENISLSVNGKTIK